MTQWKHVIGLNDKITLNEEPEILSTSNIKLVNTDESSHEESILIYKKIDLNKTKNSCVIEDDDGN